MSNQRETDRQITIELRWNHRTLLIFSTMLIAAITLASVTLVLARIDSSTRAVSPALSASTVVSYQGRVSVNNHPFSGIGYFKFAVVNVDGSTAYWSHDGTGLATAPFTPTSSVALNVSTGLFNVLLGDTSLPNMTVPMLPDAFASPDRMLRVWFSDGVHGFQRLVPDVRVASAPYALNAEFARTSPNLQQIALLKWYTAISTTQSNFAVGLGAKSVAFDGMNIWVANQASHNVSVLRASDGFQRMTLPVGTSPVALAFDGVNMWVANYSNNNVSVLRASDGFHVMTPTVGLEPNGTIAFDGVNMWVPNYGAGTISVLRASDGYHVMTPTVGGAPFGIAFDGTNMWVGDNSGNTVSVLRASDGFHVMTPTVGAHPRGLAFDGVNMWVGSASDNTVSVLRASDGFHVMTPTVAGGSWGLAFDGANMWVTNNTEGTVNVLRASDGFHIMTGVVGIGPTGIAFDGANMWIANYGGTQNYGDGTVSKR